jgi:hypothetical protein
MGCCCGSYIPVSPIRLLAGGPVAGTEGIALPQAADVLDAVSAIDPLCNGCDTAGI